MSVCDGSLARGFPKATGLDALGARRVVLITPYDQRTTDHEAEFLQESGYQVLHAVGYALDVELQVDLPGLEKSVAEEIVAGAHERCPYSNATRGNIDVKLTVV